MKFGIQEVLTSDYVHEILISNAPECGNESLKRRNQVIPIFSLS